MRAETVKWTFICEDLVAIEKKTDVFQNCDAAFRFIGAVSTVETLKTFDVRGRKVDATSVAPKVAILAADHWSVVIWATTVAVKFIIRTGVTSTGSFLATSGRPFAVTHLFSKLGELPLIFS